MNDLSPKEKIYQIFNQIQTSTEIKQNLKDLYELYESLNIKDFIEILEKVILIIFSNYEKNTVPLKNIKEFLRNFIEKISKNQKIKKKNSEFLNYFCDLFTQNTRKLRYKSLSIYFLQIFLIPYSNGNVLLYKSETLENIKSYLLNILKGKQTILLMGVLHLLDKIPALQKDSDIWERLETLINGDNKNIKREIIKIFENSNENVTKYLLEMFDDDSSEIRNFAFDKLAKIKNFDSISPKIKVKLFFIGLSDTSVKINQNTKKILKEYLNSLGILRLKRNEEKEEEKMEIDEENIIETLKEEKEEKSESNDLNITAKEKFSRATTPLKPIGKKLKDSPSRIFDELDVISFYNHPKFSYVFPLIVEAMLEIIDKDDIIQFIKDIIDNLNNIINKTGEIKQFSEKKVKKNSSFSSSGKERFDKYALFNDIYFVQNVLNVLKNKKEFDLYLNDIIDLLPDGTTYSKLLINFYISSPNIYILHQLLLIAQFMAFQDEIGNREIIEFIKKFIGDISLSGKKVNDFQFRKISFDNIFEKKEDEVDDEFNYNDITEDKRNEMLVNNYLLPIERKIIFSMEDLVDLSLIIMKLIYEGKDNQLFTIIMEVINELKDNLDTENEGSLKLKQKEIYEKMKEKISIVESLEDLLKKGNDDRIEIQKKLKYENEQIDNLEDELLSLTTIERNTLYRISLLCKFTINYCNLPQNAFENMVKELIVPGLKKNNFPEVVHISLENTGLMAINHFDSAYKNFMKIFFDNLEKDNGNDFKQKERISLIIVLDSILHNNVLMIPQEILNGNIEDKVQMIIDKYLYNENYNARVLVFIGLCKLIMENKMTKHEFILSRLFVCLYKSFKIIDKKSLNYNIKIQEIMNNFMYFYSLNGKKNIKSIIKAINIILTSQFYFSNDFIYEKNVLCDYAETKFEFLNQFLFIIYQNAQNKLKDIEYMDLIFKIFKYVFFLYKYVREEELTSPKKKEDKDENIKKKISVSLNLIKVLKNKTNYFFEKTEYDVGLYNHFKEKDSKFGKFFAYIFYLSKLKILNQFSQYLNDEYMEIQNNNFKIEIKGTEYDYSSEQKQNELNEYIKKEEKKYYPLIEEYHDYCIQLKTNKLSSLFKENKKVIKEVDESLENSVNDGKINLNKKKKRFTASASPKKSNSTKRK